MESPSLAGCGHGRPRVAARNAWSRLGLPSVGGRPALRLQPERRRVRVRPADAPRSERVAQSVHRCQRDPHSLDFRSRSERTTLRNERNRRADRTTGAPAPEALECPPSPPRPPSASTATPASSRCRGTACGWSENCIPAIKNARRKDIAHEHSTRRQRQCLFRGEGRGSAPVNRGARVDDRTGSDSEPVAVSPDLAGPAGGDGVPAPWRRCARRPRRR